MHTPIPRFLVGASIALAAAWVLIALQIPQSVEAGGIVSDCSSQYGEQALTTALATSGTITFNCPQAPYTIYLNSAITIGVNAVIDGTNGGNRISIVPVNDTRAFLVNQGSTLTLKNLNVYSGFDSDGGCIYTNGALTLNNVTMQSCLASTGTRGGAIYVSSTGSATINNSQVVSNTASLSGGGIYSLGTLTINGSYLAHNKLPDLSKQNLSSGDGGAVWAIGTTTIDSSTFYSNTAPNGWGGGIYNQLNLNVTNSTISSNYVQKGGGGIQTYLGTTTLQNVNVTDNSVSEYKSPNGGGGLMNTQGTLNLTNVTISGNKGNFAGGGIRNDGIATLTNVTISSNNAEYGGGIRNTGTLNFTGGTVSGNGAYQTGGIYILGSNSQTTLTNLTVSDNTGQANGGGIQSGGMTNMSNLTVTGNKSTGGYGGGIAGGTTLVNSTVSGNTAYRGGGVWGINLISKSTISGNTANAEGGGVYNGQNIVNSTISGNFSKESGGGIYVDQYGATSLFNVTVTQNKANSDASGSGVGGGVANVSGTFNFINSIIARNSNIYLPGPVRDYDDCSGTLTSQGNNLMYQNISVCNVIGSVAFADPLLGSLQNNGGSTQTHALLTNSPAIDAGNLNGCKDNNNNTLTSDQRGFIRPFPAGGRCDIGAFEYSIKTVQDNDSALQFNGWRNVSDSNASGGAYRMSNVQNDNVTFKFQGKAVQWITHKGPDMGKALVTIDGVDKGTFDLYDASAQGFTEKFGGLATGKHTLVIRVLHKKSKNAMDFNVAVDAFRVGANTLEANNCAVKYNTWACKADSSASGESYRFSASAKGAARLEFSGVSIDWIGATGPNFGMAQVTIDGASQGTFDLFSGNAQAQAVIHSFTNLGGGTHTIEIKPLHGKNANSSGYNVSVDALRGPIQAQ